jgi:adenine-specific DNA-methyltransferase
VSRETAALLISNQDVVLVRRFSAKEDAHRIVACCVTKSELGGRFGVENHLNIISGFRGSASSITAGELCAYLNSDVVDDWFRASSGTTQINARDLRDLPIRLRKPARGQHTFEVLAQPSGA